MSTEIIGATHETWKPVVGAEGWYSVSSLGRVRSEPTANPTSGRQRGRILSPSMDRKGYPTLRICVPGRKRPSVRVHALVAEAFLGPKPDGRQVNHISGDKSDNRPGNLEYVTCLENIRHCWATGLHQPTVGERVGTAKLTADDVRAIRAAHPRENLASLADRYRITKQNVWFIVHRKTWRHV